MDLNQQAKAGMQQSHPSFNSGLLASTAWLAVWSTAIVVGRSGGPSARFATQLGAEVIYTVGCFQILNLASDTRGDTMLLITSFCNRCL